jgi:pilus assembly protein Flp/PilA
MFWLRKMAVDENRESMVEYGLIIALVAIVIMGILLLVNDNLQNVFSKISGSLGNIIAGK